TLRFSRIGDFYTLRLGFFGNLDLRIIKHGHSICRRRQEIIVHSTLKTEKRRHYENISSQYRHLYCTGI
ncbi:hypothetical protein, partial [Barnesiella intestinihominis]|uniref:hypothetical protein n=1 Tax=Barnesiella intestinihominis TaxID=487174 RepID=UPI003A92B53E